MQELYGCGSNTYGQQSTGTTGSLVSTFTKRASNVKDFKNINFEIIICSLVTSGLFAFIMIVCALITEPLVSGSILGFSLGFEGILSAAAGKVLSYVFLAIVIAAMRKIGHKVCNDLEVE